MKFLVEVCGSILQALTQFQTKMFKFPVSFFQTWHLKFIAIFRPDGGWRESLWNSNSLPQNQYPLSDLRLKSIKSIFYFRPKWFEFKVANYSFCTVRALICARFPRHAKASRTSKITRASRGNPASTKTKWPLSEKFPGIPGRFQRCAYSSKTVFGFDN